MKNNNINLKIARGTSRLAKHWRNVTITWRELLALCADTRRTNETVAEYAAMSRDEQTRIKDVGGFVGGYLAGGVRKGSAVTSRSVVTIDIDNATPETWARFKSRYKDICAAVYSTHKHTPEHPRLRLLLPASREMSPQEYEPVSRRWAQRIGIEEVDHTTHDINRLFYWPSTSKNGVFVFDHTEGEPFDVDAVLATYQDWRDASAWPTSTREANVIAREIRRAADPTGKPGIVGAFCRAYSITDVIDKFLSDVYEPTAQPDRYTYREGSVAGGLVIYADKWAYSHHDTDPASHQLYNGFDLLRAHKFADLDEGRTPADITKAPSYRAMIDFAGNDPGVRRLLDDERREAAQADFASIADTEPAESGTPAEPAEKADDWRGKLAIDKNGNVKPTAANYALLMQHDEHLKGIKYDTFAQCNTLPPKSPFRGTHAPLEVDDASLASICAYLSRRYGLDMSTATMSEKILLATARSRSYNPVQEFINAEKWDGVKRVDTLLIDYLGAIDTPLTRAITRKWMAAAVGRAFDIDPDTGEGIKFDYCLTLFGEQGTGKSTFSELLAGRWGGTLSLSLARKEQCETLMRAWIAQLSEFDGLARAESETVKDLISRRSDDFRAAYSRVYAKNPRHCVFIGSTNNEHFLKDFTGNRRFWIVRVTGGKGGPRAWATKLRKEVPQIWAEAKEIYQAGEELMLSPDQEREMAEIVKNYGEEMGDPLREYLADWLEIRLPADWPTRDIRRRREYYCCYDPNEPEGVVRRDEVAVSEIVTTCPYPGITRYSPQRIGAILRSLGWERQKRGRLGGRFSDKVDYDGKKGRATLYVRVAASLENQDAAT